MMNKPSIRRKSETIARPNMWKRKGMHKRMVYFKRQDKQGRVYTKTPGGLRCEDLVMNKRRRVVSKKQHARGVAMWSTLLKPFFEARRTVVAEFSASKFLRARFNGTEAERKLFVAMAQTKKEYYERCGKALRMQQIMPNVAIPLGEGSVQGAIAEADNSVGNADNIVGDDIPFFPSGSKVVLHGLEALDYNGVTGTICSWDVAQQRYGVDTGRELKAIKPCNLRLA